MNSIRLPAIIIGIVCLVISCAPNPLENDQLIIVTNEDDGTITFISGNNNEVLETLAVGKRPRGIRISPDRLSIFVALSGSPKCPPSVSDEECAKLKADKSRDGIAEIDLHTKKVRRILPGGSDPEQFDLSPDGKYLFVSNEDANLATKIDLSTGKIVYSVPVGLEPEGVRVIPGGRFVYVTSESDHTVTVINSLAGTRQSIIPVGRRPRDIVFNKAGTLAYVTSELDHSVAIIDINKNKIVKTIAISKNALPMGILLSPDEKTLYVSNGRAKTIAVIDVAKQQVMALVEVGARPWGLALTDDGKFLYTANGPSNDVSVIETNSLKVVKKIKVGKTPWGIVVVRVM
jgi:YVTN family beta-propeller protein